MSEKSPIEMYEEWRKFARKYTRIAIVVVFAVILNISWGFYKDYRQSSKADLEDKVKALEFEMAEKNSKIQELNSQLIPFKTIALQKFSSDDVKALQRLAFDIKQIEQDFANDRQYRDIAKGDVFGSPISSGSTIVITTPISQALEGCYEKKNGEIFFKYDDGCLEKYLNLTRNQPKHPLAFFIMAGFLKEKGDSKWRDYAAKAKEILLITTRIDGHHPFHDELLAKIEAMLK